MYSLALFVEQETPRIFLPYTPRKKITGENVIIQATTTAIIITIIIIIIITKFTRVDYGIKCASYKQHLKSNIVTVHERVRL